MSVPLLIATHMTLHTTSSVVHRPALLLRRQTGSRLRQPMRCQTGSQPQPPVQCRCSHEAAGRGAEAAAAAPGTAAAAAAAAAVASRWLLICMGCLRRGLGAGGRGNSRLRAMKTCQSVQRSGRGSCGGRGGRSTPGNTTMVVSAWHHSAVLRGVYVMLAGSGDSWRGWPNIWLLQGRVCRAASRGAVNCVGSVRLSRVRNV